MHLKIRQDYKASDMPTVAENIRKEKDVQAAFVEDAIIGVGPYELASPFKQFQVDAQEWTYKWSQRQRDQHLKTFHRSILPKREQDVIVINPDDEASPTVSQKNDHPCELPILSEDYCELPTERRSDHSDPSSASATNCELSVPFTETGLSPVYRLAYEKAVRLSESNSIVKAPGKHVRYLTESEAGTAPNFVQLKMDGCCDCQCQTFKVSSVCSHALAVAHIAGCLDKYLVWYHTKSGGVNLTATATITAPKNSGMKPGQRKRQ